INLMPEDYLKLRAKRRTSVICLILFAVVMVGVLTAALLSEESRRRTLQVRDRVDGDYAEAAKLIRQMQHLQARKSTLLRKAELTASLMERVPRSYLLAVVTNALPQGASLTKFDLERKRLTVIAKSARSSGSKKTKFATVSQRRLAKSPPYLIAVNVTGLAGTDIQVARFIANVAGNPLARSVDLIYSQEKIVDDVTLREFRIRIDLRIDVDVIDILRDTSATEMAQKKSAKKPATDARS
ncbi:unnamed protein product, partial [marine sediment metagenome]